MQIEQPSVMHVQPSTQAQRFFERANFLVVKLTDYCNLRCKYCHQDALFGKPVLMPLETFKNGVRLVLGTSQAPIVYVQFHGGEPLLMPDEFFQEAVEFSKKLIEGQGRKVEFMMQTNLTKVTPAREKVLNDLGIRISFSMDGPPEMNDELRGGGVQILNNWRRMKANGTDAGTICLIQPTNWERMNEVVDFFDEEEIFNVRFNLMVPDGRGEEIEKSGADHLFNAKKYVLDYMLETEGARVTDATLITAMKKFTKTNGAPSSFEYHGCESLYCQAGRGLYSMNPDGRFYACDRIAEYSHWAMGNVNTDFKEPHLEVAQKKRRDFHVKDDWWARCEGCDAQKICEFSCSAYYVDKIDTREIECQYTKKLWSYMLEKQEEIFRFVAKGLAPIAIDEKRPLQDQDEETWVIKDLAADAFFNHLKSVEIVADNQHYQLARRGEQYFLYLYKRHKIFEVDEMVAEICRFNGTLSSQMIEELLSAGYERGKLKTTLREMTKTVPEVFQQSVGLRKRSVVAEASADAARAPQALV